MSASQRPNPKLPANYIILRNSFVIAVEWAIWIIAIPQRLARTSSAINRLVRETLGDKMVRWSTG
jgi:hypothetical protein